MFVFLKNAEEENGGGMKGRQKFAHLVINISIIYRQRML